MKKRLIVLLAIFAVITTIGSHNLINAKRPYYPEPERKPEIPSHILWNSDKGEYYNGLDFAWDSDKNKYVPKDMPMNNNENGVAKNPFPTWLEEHKNSTDIIDRAVIEYTNAPVDTKSIKLSFYNPYDDPNLKIITDLGINNIPQMLKRIKYDKAISPQLMCAIQVMTHTDAGLLDASDEGSEIGLLNFISKAKNSEKIMMDAHKKLKLAKSTATKETVKNEIASVGIFGLPYAQEESKKGNKELLNIFKEKYGEKFISIDTNEILNLIETIQNEF